MAEIITTTSEIPVVEAPKATKPWAPARVLEVPERFKDPRFSYRWASKNQVGRVEKLISEGWEIDTELSKKMNGNLPKTIHDGSSLDGTMQKRELIVMRIPKELAQGRKDYYAQKSASVRREAEEQLIEAGRSRDGKGSLVYGKIKRD